MLAVSGRAGFFELLCATASIRCRQEAKYAAIQIKTAGLGYWEARLVRPWSSGHPLATPPDPSVVSAILGFRIRWLAHAVRSSWAQSSGDLSLESIRRS